jgi:thiamine biosynthesis lipoprotein
MTVVVAIALAWWVRGRNAEVPYVEIRGPTMGTTFNIKCVSDDQQDSINEKALVVQVQNTLADINRKMSTYVSDSELSRLNKHDSDEPFQLSAETAEVFACSLEISRLTEGAFDITVGPLVNAYGFGPDPEQRHIPTDSELAELRKRVGYQKLDFDSEAGTVVKQKPDLYCDLSAVAKGYAVDQLAMVLEKAGIKRYMVEVGGEVRTLGLNSADEPWQIAIEKPLDAERVNYLRVELSGEAVATSGDYRNFFIKDGQRISHTIDPRTGRPVEHDLASVTVVHDSCMYADAWATAMMVLDPEEGARLAESRGLAVLFLIRGEDDTIIKKTTSAFNERVAAFAIE